MEGNIRQPNRLEESAPLCLGAFKRANLDHHHDADTCSRKIAVPIGDNLIVDDESGIAWFHGGDDILENLPGLFVVPVVEDPVHVVCAGACGLLVWSHRSSTIWWMKMGGRESQVLPLTG